MPESTLTRIAEQNVAALRRELAGAHREHPNLCREECPCRPPGPCDALLAQPTLSRIASYTTGALPWWRKHAPLIVAVASALVLVSLAALALSRLAS